MLHELILPHEHFFLIFNVLDVLLHFQRPLLCKLLLEQCLLLVISLGFSSPLLAEWFLEELQQSLILVLIGHLREVDAALVQ